MARYDERTAEQILSEMLDSARDDIDKRQGSVAFDMLAPVAQELEFLGFELQALYEQGFLDTAVGDALDYHVNEVGLTRKPATSSVGFANITGTTGTVIPVGYRFVSASGASFATTAQTTIFDGVAAVPVSAVVPGVLGDLGIGELTDHERNIVGIDTVTNVDIFTGGVDAEEDDVLRERALFKIRAPITSGNANHYRLWATEVAGVASAKVFPTFNGPNTVKVVVIAQDGGAPAESIVTAVAEYIETQRPIGAAVTVQAIEEVGVDVSATLTLREGIEIDNVLTTIRTSLTSYLLSEAQSGIIRYNRIGEAIIDVDGVLDYENLFVNGGTVNFMLTAEQVGIVGELTFT